ncbi:MAG: choice-of-anchor D domain-containing protein [Bacteroidetes bacterium]|nr:choice-of-anchor D domain-containing protein [Bacteroidota bacterium]
MKTLTAFISIIVFNALSLSAVALPHGTASLAIVKPNGNELFATGDTTTIEWTGVQPQDTVLLEFSTDSGKSWSLITDMATGLQYRWAIPALSSDSCLMRVAQREFPQAVLTLPHKRLVTDVVFTATGNEVITSVDDGGVKMWNAVNGNQRYSIDSAKARFISISPSGAYFSVSNLLNDGSIWDVTTGQIRNRSFSFTPVLGRIAFLNNDTIALPIGNNIYPCRYNLPTGITTVYGNLLHGRTVNDTRFNALKTRLIAGSNDSVAIVWNYTNKTKTAQLPHTSAVWTVDISADATRALTDDKAGNVYYWNTINGKLIAQLGDKNFTSSRLSPDGKHALGGGRTQTRTINGQTENYADGVIWDVTSHNPIRYLRGHHLGITSVCYSLDGSRMATASADSTVKIWDLSEIQSAVSALPWRITQPVLSADDIDMKMQYAGEQKDSIISKILRNQSLADVRVRSVRLTGGDSSKFSIKNLTAQQILTPNSSENIEIVFSPDSVRKYSTTLEIITQNQVIRRTVNGEGVLRLARWTQGIDLGKVYVGDRRDSTIELVITNVSQAPLPLTAMLQSSDITILSGGGAVTVPAGQPHSFTITFAPTKVGIITTALQIEFNGYGSPIMIPVTGEGVCSSGGETIRVGSSDAIPAQSVTIPVVLSFPKNSLQSLLREYSFDVKFNKTVLLPVEPTPTGTVAGNDRIIHISGRQEGNDTLTQLHLMTAIGTAETAVITVENFEWIACTTTAAGIAGEVHITVCKEGSPRLYNPDGETATLAILPNTVRGDDTQVKFSTPEIGRINIAIINVLGTAVPLFSGEMTAGDYTLPLSVNLPAGVYFVRMTTPSQVIIKRIVIE